MLVVVERGEELLKSEFVRGWVNHVVDKTALEMKIMTHLSLSEFSTSSFISVTLSECARRTAWTPRCLRLKKWRYVSWERIETESENEEWNDT